ncbi:MAG: baseplate J/gp47 family protein [Gammaproteobacteria bacterium]|nr:baseplate J/gp47 family protein [Gammaproteobacteria bacterium]
MKDRSANSRIIDGTDQWQREPLPFQPCYFNADEMSFEMLLSMASEYAENFNYYNVVNQKDGSWGSLFNANEVVIMVLIATHDLPRLTLEFSRLESSSIVAHAEYVVQVASMLDYWLQRLASASTESAVVVRRHIHDMASMNLLDGLHTAADIIYRSEDGLERLEAVNISGLSPVWNIHRDGDLFSFSQARELDLNDYLAVKAQLESTLLKMVEAVRYLKTVVVGALEQSLKGQAHEPAIGLYMVFLHLYQAAQKRLNHFTARHLDFYYRDCLQTAPRKRKTESLFLKFEPAAGAKPFIVDSELAFTSEKNSRATNLLYHLKEPLLVRRAHVCSLKTLYLQRNRLMSPECEMGHVTRMKFYERTLSQEKEVEIAVMPFFGDVKSGVQLAGMTDAITGFSIASPIMALKEGRREIELTIDFMVPDTITIDHEFSDKRIVDSVDSFRSWFGKIFSYYLLMGTAFLNEARRTRMVELITQYDEDGACEKLLESDWEELFYRLLKRPFAISLSAEDGWLTVNDYLISPAIEDDNGSNSGLKVTLSLDHSVAAVIPYNSEIHGGNRVCELPMINVLIDPEASFFSYSLLNSLAVSSVEIDVAVTGVKDVVISNHLGRLDPTKPFSPFGPLPTRHSYLVVGSREAAGKQVTRMELALEWGDLPMDIGGFPTYYQGYDFAPLSSNFEAEITVLQNGNWMPNKAETQYRAGLFESGKGGVVRDKKTVFVGAAGYFKPLDSAEIDQRFEYRSGARNGFVRLQMSSPDSAFGHAEYPQLLTRILTENSRRKKPIAVPNPPYTPLIKQILLSYKAHSVIKMGVDFPLNQPSMDERFFHVHPFGVKQEYPTAKKHRVQLFPHYEDDGNLFIGIEAAELNGTLNLYFDLDEETTSPSLSSRSLMRWYCLTKNGWRLLEPNRLLSDSTEGFLMSGVVTVDLPVGMISDSLVMPTGQYWLKVATSGALESFAGLSAIVTNVAQLECAVKTVESNERMKAFDRDTVWRSVAKVAGLAELSTVGHPSGGRAAEDERHYRKRVSERLRHKGRASTSWDYERLVLERFPAIYKVKCFPNTVCYDDAPHPGNILVVVVPEIKLKQAADRTCERGMVNSAELVRVRTFIQKLVSPFVTVEVRNPAYERIQVRCTVKFAGDINAGGLYINQLNQALSDYICPWCDTGYQAKFGWVIRADDIESYIRELDYVDFVTNFSMLHITDEANEKHTLKDTAKQDNRHDAMIEPRYPWSLAVPMRRHFIETATSVEPVEAKPTGVNELEIGRTFIIGRN